MAGMATAVMGMRDWFDTRRKGRGEAWPLPKDVSRARGCFCCALDLLEGDSRGGCCFAPVIFRGEGDGVWRGGGTCAFIGDVCLGSLSGEEIFRGEDILRGEGIL